MYEIIKRWFDIRIIYTIVFLTLAGWSFFAYFTMNKLINEQKVYAKIINLSGKQRMLSQKTTLIAKRYLETNNDSLKIHLRELIVLMKKDHSYIINNLTSENTHNIYFNNPYNLNRKVNLYISTLEKFYESKSKDILSDIEEFSFILLPKLNHSVNVFEKESAQITQSLLKREYFILIGTLITLLLEAIFIVIPSIRLARQKEKELKKLNQNLEQKIQKAIKENQKKENILKHQFRLAQMGEMITNISHQWRQPLSVISSLASGIKLEKELDMLDDKKLNEKLDTIVDKTKYLSNVINDFNTFMEENNEELNFFSVQKSIDSTLNILKGSFKNKNIEVTTKYPKNDIKLKGNNKNFKQLILNILNNAKEALENKVSNKELNIKLTDNSDSVCIEIENNGDKIDNHIISKIFDIYFTTKHQSQGTGLGLFICHEIVSKHFKGTITAENLKNSVIFKITIPKEN